ncbi:MAG: alanine--tRNA ligase [bacterium TMED198]|nr:MAG: alanine--tRNA ligase [bacterium TMED198]
MPSSLIRKQFIDFFKAKQHTFIKSAPVAPNDDPTLLFTNAGMNQFKPIFLDQQKPTSPRAVNYQKCIRVSGKHNDLEEVGVDDYHHTFFEMLGNWSFGDYYKEDAITWAWELITKVWKMDKRRLWVSIYKEDEESKTIWLEKTDIPENRVLKFGKKDNFWEMGDTGPCGPCTEIHYYVGDDISGQSSKGVNCEDDYREFWNLVFIQYNRDSNGSLNDLPNKHVDTGAGFERVVSIMNLKKSNYETDLFVPLIEEIEKISGKSKDFESGVAHRVISDHIRMLGFSLADGAIPGSDGRGYVLRRILRRASRFGRTLGLKDPFLYKLVEVLSDTMGEFYAELEDNKDYIKKIILKEEESFGLTLDKGLEVFSSIVKDTHEKDEISGQNAFKLYDTYGFPLDLTELLAREKNLTVDRAGFEFCMDEQRARGKKSSKFSSNKSTKDWIEVLKVAHSDFLGYEEESCLSKVAMFRLDGGKAEIVLDQTPFYAESGGQVGDKGVLRSDTFYANVFDTQKTGDKIIHFCIVKKGDIRSQTEVISEIDHIRRNNIKLNHTATHLLHSALKEVLGKHVQQAGSLVDEDKLRFDLTHYEKLSQEEISMIEMIVNREILKNILLSTDTKSFDDAKSEGAQALFGEKYGDLVRVVDIPGFSMELCGGTHVSRTGDIGSFKISKESSLASGIRRIEAVTGLMAVERANEVSSQINDLKNVLSCSSDSLLIEINNLIHSNKSYLKEISRLRRIEDRQKVKIMVDGAEEINGCKVIVGSLEQTENLKSFGQDCIDQSKSPTILLIGNIKDKAPLVVCAVSNDMVKKVNAAEIAKSVSKVLGGGGGGKPGIATAGGRKPEALDEALKVGYNEIISRI